jgi:penicillin-binding protein 1A
VTRRVVVPVDSMPEHLLNAFVAIEDRRFWDHGGVDWRRTVGALMQNVRARDIEEGSSTITMQLARNVFPEQLPASERTLTRKLGEARMARQIESRYSKRRSSSCT